MIATDKEDRDDLIRSLGVLDQQLAAAEDAVVSASRALIAAGNVYAVTAHAHRIVRERLMESTPKKTLG